MEIGAWGDSITYGEGDSEGLGWVGRLRKACGTEEISIYNRGICGDTSEGLLKRFSVEADSVEPDIIFFAIGINDSKCPKGEDGSLIPLDMFKNNMHELVAQAKKHTEKIFVIGLTKVDESIDRWTNSRFKNEVIRTYNSALKELCDSEHLTFIDMFDVFELSDLADGLHPNAGGYQKMFEVIEPFIKDAH